MNPKRRLGSTAAFSIFAVSLCTVPTLALADDQVVIDEVVVTGTRSARTQREAPIRTDVVGYTVLQYAAPKTLADALEFLPGARAENNCQNCNTTEIQLLGLPGAYNQILFDGLPMMSGVAAVYGVEQVPAVLIDRIEVVKGGASALYGPGAVAGVVNVLPKIPERSGTRVSAGLDRSGNASIWNLSAAQSWVSEATDTYTTLYGQFEDGQALDLNSDGFSEIGVREQAILGLRSSIVLSGRSRLNLDYQYVSEDRRGGDALERATHEARIAEALETSIHRGSLEYVYTPDAVTSINAVVSYAGLDRSSYYGGLGGVVLDVSHPDFDPAEAEQARADARNMYGRTTNDLWFGELRGQKTVGAHALAAGIQYRQEDVVDDNLDAEGAWLARLNAGRFRNTGVFVQDEWSLSSQIKLIAGLRADKNSELEEVVLSPRLGLWWSPASTWVVRANYSSGFRAPELFSEDVHVETLGGEPVRIVNADDLDPEKARSFSLGFDWRPLWNDAAVSVDGQVYLTELKDAFALGEITSSEEGLYQLRSNTSGARVAGVELNANWRVRQNVQVTAGLAWLNASYDEAQTLFDDEEGTLVQSRRFMKAPRLTAVAQDIWNISSDWDGYVAVRHTGPMKVLNNNTGRLETTQDFFIADVSLTRHIHTPDGKEFDVTFGIKNLFDQRQDDLESGPDRDATYVYGPRVPRSAFIRLNAAF
ncbi:TonB-dependent receptor [Brevundimonas sp.]|uniref:TonB-dependent receptor plug domain-containing protein n=1 Tax=Brevundimonas sp. TaxID=1871086 RepID=UPI0028A13280|nr:TonB-dependent receptor [Brevundimonas sp.]